MRPTSSSGATSPALTALPLSPEDAAEIRALLNLSKAVQRRPDMPLGIRHRKEATR